jgi:DNA-binding NarL/FixJ family response regulator
LNIAGGDGADPTAQTVWALIDPRALIREALIGMIEAAGSPPVLGADSAQDLVARVVDASRSVDLIMLHAPGGLINDEQSRRDCVMLTKGLIEVPVVVLSDRIDLTDISHAIRAGARGYIVTSCSCPAVMRALRHVQAGGIYLPEEALSGFCHAASESGHNTISVSVPRNQKFTPRQLQVLTLIRHGKPNKIIAHELGMQESTVKVHVREIMKKLKVSNRTEAALRAGQLLADLGEEDVPDVSKRQAIGQAS